MDESQIQEETKGKEEKEPIEKKSATPLINRADEAAERLEKALVKERENLRIREALVARDVLGGRADGGFSSQKTEEQIKKAATEHKSTMIVLGTKSKSIWKEKWVGSVAHNLADNSELPVLVIPAEVS